MDDVWGLPLKITSQHCDCSLQANGGHQCTYYLEHQDGGPEIMQIRFRWGEPVYGNDVRESLEELDADREWLDRVLPRRSRLGGSAVGRGDAR